MSMSTTNAGIETRNGLKNFTSPSESDSITGPRPVKSQLMFAPVTFWIYNKTSTDGITLNFPE
jgi:hypothetical protein